MTEQNDQNADKSPELPPEVNEVLDKLVAGYQKPADILGENGWLKQLTKALVERALEAEMTHHLGYSKYAPDGKNSGNSRNGREPKLGEDYTEPVKEAWAEAFEFISRGMKAATDETQRGLAACASGVDEPMAPTPVAKRGHSKQPSGG